MRIDTEIDMKLSLAAEAKLRRNGMLGMKRFWSIPDSDDDKFIDDISNIIYYEYENYGLDLSISSVFESLRYRWRGLSNIHRLESILIALGFTVNRWIYSGVKADADDPDRPHMRRTVTL